MQINWGNELSRTLHENDEIVTHWKKKRLPNKKKNEKKLCLVMYCVLHIYIYL